MLGHIQRRSSWSEDVTHVEVLNRAGIKKQLFNKINKHKLTLFGHITRQEGMQRGTLEGMVGVKEAGKTKNHIDRQHQGLDGEHRRAWWRVKEAVKTKSHMDRQHQGVDLGILVGMVGVTEAGKTKNHIDRQHQGVDGKLNVKI